jgi:multidrug transporter EmrE-like cation transporter
MLNLNGGLRSGALLGKASLVVLGLVAANLAFNVLSNASFKLSIAGGWRTFLVWQVIGNLSGLVTVLTLTWLLRYIPLHTAFPVTTGLAVLGVQIFAAAWYFHESIGPAQWLGAVLVSLGIIIIGV